MDDPAITVRAVANLLNFSTLVGLAVARAGRAQISRGPRGLWYAERYTLPFPLAGAFTLGNVIITPRSIDEIGESAAAHEERHTWQYTVCGTLFMPLYLTAMGWSWIRTGDRAARNIFERAAGLSAGGYVDVPVRPLRRVFERRVSG